MATLFAQQAMIHTNCDEVIRLAAAPPCLPPVLGGGSFYSQLGAFLRLLPRLSPMRGPIILCILEILTEFYYHVIPR